MEISHDKPIKTRRSCAAYVWPSAFRFDKVRLQVPIVANVTRENGLGKDAER